VIGLLTCFWIAGQPASPVWALEEIRLVNGARLSGYLVDESAAGYRFRVVRRPPGRPTVTLTSLFPKSEVAGVARLPDAERTLLRDRLADLDRVEHSERHRLADLDLKPEAWLGKSAAAKRYDGESFVLISNADEDITRRAALRLEQIFTAYARYLPARTATIRPVTMLLAPSRADFESLLPGRSIANPAIYDAAAHRIVIGSDLRVLSSDLAAARLHHAQQLGLVDDYDRRIRELYKNAPQAERDRHSKTATDQRAKVQAADRANDRRFDEATATLFALMYHETFHAYVSASVYTAATPAELAAGTATGPLPRWLNEGLAQLFETAILDGRELRVGHADRARLERIQNALRTGKAETVLVPIERLLTASAEDFVAAHATQKETTDAMYLTAWAIAFHVTFEKRLLATPAFDDSVRSINRGGDPVAAFAALVSSDPKTYALELREYLQTLQPDGSRKKPSTTR
jgi:hypothetical protein